MKKIFTLFAFCYFLVSQSNAQFKAGNLVVLKVNGTTSAAQSITLLEFQPDGTRVDSVVISSSGTNKLTVSGSATSEGALTLSNDGRFLTFVGYDANAGTASVANTNSATVARVIGRIDNAKNVDLSTKLNAFSTNNIRSAVTNDGSGFWISGATGGILYATIGSTGTSFTTVASTPANTRVLNIFNNQLYVSAGTGTNQSVATVGTGLPTGTGNTITQLPGLPTSGTNASYAYAFFDLSNSVAGNDVLYVADQSTGANGGIRKYSLVSGTWVLNGTINTASPLGVTGLAATLNNQGQVVLFTTSGTATDNRVVTFTDNTGYNGTPSGNLLPLSNNLNAGFGSIYRGVAFAPTLGDLTLSSSNNISGNYRTIITEANVTATLTADVNLFKNFVAMPGSAIEVGANTLTVSNYGKVILQSDATGTARIGTVNAGGSVSGFLTQELFIPAKSARKWSLVSSPVSQILSDSWQQQVHITGAGTGGTACPTLTAHSNGFDATVTNTPSLYTYDASLASGSRWVVATNTNATATQPGAGYRIFIRGNRNVGGCALLDGSTSGTTAVTLSSTGIISNTAKNLGSFSLTYNNNLSNNWILVGNPYPSQISFSAFRTTNSAAINNTYAIYVPESPSGVYSYWDGSSFTGGTGYNNATGNVIANGTAFFVQAVNNTNLTLSFEESHKTSSAANTYVRTNAAAKQIKVHYTDANDKQIDEVAIKYGKESFDIVSMNSGSNYITTVKNNQYLVVNAKKENDLEQEHEIALNVVSTVNGNYKLGFTVTEELAANNEVYLKDNYTHTLTNIKELKNGYVFTTDNNITATKGTGRFSVVVKPNSNANMLTENTVKVYPNPVMNELQVETKAQSSIVAIKIINIEGKVVMQQKVNTALVKVNVANLQSGIYTVELTSDNAEVSTQKFVKQ